MSSFFLPSKTKSGALGKRRKKLSQVKKKRDSKAIKNKKIPLATTIPTDEDEDIPSDSDTENKDYQSLSIDEDFSDREETAPEKRLRLAKDYLQQLKAEERGSSSEEDEDDDVDNDAIGRRLQEKALEKSGRIHKAVADQCTAPPLESIRFSRGHRLSVTSLALTPDGRYAFTGSKDSCIIKWNVEKGAKEVMITRGGKEGAPGHTGHVLALAVSTDGMYLASGGTDNLIHMWNPLTCIHLHTFRGHKNSVTGLVFQHGANQLFSSSLDRTVKVWNISEMTYVETLFGHQDGIIAIDCLSQERPITAGVDKTIRVWKIIEESHLVYHGHKSSIDTVKMINDKNFVSGSQDGSVALWNNSKKKPQVLKSSSHDSADVWITAVTALPHSDLVASGSRDGNIHFWKCGESFRTLEKLFTVPLPGFINSLSFSSDGRYLAAGVGQEHRLGRWWKDTSTKNGIAFIPLNVKNNN